MAERTCVTIKTGKGYDDSWYVFEGTTEEIEGQLLRFFGTPEGYDPSTPLIELAEWATAMAQGKAPKGFSQTLGATVVEDTQEGSEAVTEAPEAREGASQDEEDFDWDKALTEALEAAKTKLDVRTIFAEHKDQLKAASDEVRALYNSQMKTLPGK